MSRWRTENCCTKCERSLSDSQKMYSDGCCPHCGNTNEGTIVSTFKKTNQIPPSRIRTAWTIWKLNAVRRLLRPIMRWHIKRELKRRGQ
jgi:hypothetical protein